MGIMRRHRLPQLLMSHRRPGRAMRGFRATIIRSGRASYGAPDIGLVHRIRVLFGSGHVFTAATIIAATGATNR